MIEKCLRAKHWHLFLLIIGPVVIGQISMLTLVFSRLEGSGGQPNPDEMMTIFGTFFSVVMLLSLVSYGVIFGWIYSLAVGTQRFIPDALKMNVQRFKIAFWIPIVYFVSMMIGMIFFFQRVFENPNAPVDEEFFSYFGIIALCHLIAIGCIIYAMRFAAKAFKTAELKRRARFSDYIGEFFLLWFSFIGVWIIQPKVNEMVNAEEKDIIQHLV